MAQSPPKSISLRTTSHSARPVSGFKG